MAHLPSDRHQIEQPPFSHVGIDCFSPFNVRQALSTVKRYGCVFTCLTVRAIRIEVAYSMSTDSFLCVLRKFIAYIIVCCASCYTWKISAPFKRQWRQLCWSSSGVTRIFRRVELRINSKSTISFCKKISNGVSVLPQPVTWVELGRG